MAAARVTLPQCDLCESTEYVKWFCVNCSEKICERCRSIHNKGRKTRNDKIITIEEARNHIYQEPLPKECKKHEGKSRDLFCETCSEEVCSQCVVYIHKGHDNIPIGDALVKKRKRLDEAIEKVKKKVVSCEESIEHLEFSHTLFTTSVQSASTQIESRYVELESLLSNARAKRRQDIDNFVRKEELNYVKCKEQFVHATKQLKSIMADSNALLANQDYSVASKLLEKLNQLPDIFIEQPLPIKVVFEQGTETNLDSIFGKVVQAPRSNRGTLDIDNCCISKIETTENSIIYVVIPLCNGKLWIGYMSDNFLVQINNEGQEILRSVTLDAEIKCGDVTSDEHLVVTTELGNKILSLGKKGSSVKILADVSPMYTMRFCLTNDDDIIITLRSTNEACARDNRAQVRRYSLTGQIIQIIDNETDRNLSLSFPWYITVLSGDMIALVDDDIDGVLLMDSKGQHVQTWNATDFGIQNRSRTKECGFLGITNDMNDNIYVVNDENDRLYMIPPNGEVRIICAETEFSSPAGLVLRRGVLYVGCEGALYKIKTRKD